MKNPQLSHASTPAELAAINEKIEQRIADEDLDTKDLLGLMQQRETFIQAYLRTLDKPAVKTFAQAELQINQKLTELAKQYQSDVLQQITKILRGRKSVQKYK